MIWIVDASVAAKWFVREPLKRAADSLLAGQGRLVAPTFMLAEAANIFWKKARRGEMEPVQGLAAQASLPMYIQHLVPTDDLIHRALQIAITLGHPVYDCLNLACVERVDGVLVTADTKLIANVAGTDFASRIAHLRQWDA